MIKLGAQTFFVPVPGGMRSFAFQQRVLPVAGRVVTVFMRLIGSASEDPAGLLEADVMRVLPQALPYVGQIFSEMPPGELEAMTRELLKDAKADKIPLFGSPGGDAFDGLMQGRTMDTWHLLWHALEVWYPDFFARARASFAPAAKASPSEGSTTSTANGQVGASL